LFENDMGFKPYETLERGPDRVRAGAFVAETLSMLRKAGFTEREEAQTTTEGQVRLDGTGGSAWVERGSDRLRRIEWDGGRLVTEIDYPKSIHPNRLGIPPEGWQWPEDWGWLSFRLSEPLPRFDLDWERREFAQRVARAGRQGLVGVFQSVTDPNKPIYVVYVSPTHPRLAKLDGAAKATGIVTFRRSAPRVVAAVFIDRRGSRVTVHIPTATGFAVYRDVEVLPFSNQLRSGFRPETP
jgi:hypothetical protein